MMMEALRQGMSVVIDEENLDGTAWGLFTTRASQLHVPTEWHTMKTTAETCKQNLVKSFGQFPPGSQHTFLDIDRKAELYAAWLKQ